MLPAKPARPTPVIAKFGKFEYALADHFRIEDELGRGAMGIVYRATDLRLGRPVAIKLLHPALTNELGAARFQSEIRIAAGLHHPNIIGVHDCGEADGRLYYVMDYLGGETLRDRLNREKQLSIEDALRIVEQIAEGLQCAHDHDVIHRDIKPENIVLAEGRACLVDFGLARVIANVDTARLTATGVSVGTPHYLSPEQAAAERHVGPGADQYALACVLYEMLAGEPPFTGPTAQSIAMRHISEQPRSLRSRRPSTPAGIDAAVRRALEKVPADRFANTREFARSLRRPVPLKLGDGQSDRTSRDATSVRSFSNVSRGLLGALALIVTLVLGVASYSRYADGSRGGEGGSIRVALLPLVADASRDRVRAAAVVEGVVAELRLFEGIVGIGMPSPGLVDEVESDHGAAIAAARRRGARYVVLLAGFNEGSDGVRIEVLDTQTGDSFGRERVMVAVGSDDAATGAGVALGIARALVSRDSLFALGLRSVLETTRSPKALSHLIEGQRRFAEGDIAGASTEYRRASDADSTCILAFYRLSVAAAWDYHYAEALMLADSGLGRLTASDDRMRRLLNAQRYFVMRRTDSAIAGFSASVADDPDNVDGWLGLAQTMYYFGWEAGYRIGDARAAFDRVLYLDSAFAPIHHLLVDVALATGDTTAAKTALRRIGMALPWRRAKELLVRYATTRGAERERIFRELGTADQYTLSELVLQFSRTLDDPRSADRVAEEMRAVRRSPESRRRGAQYQLALSRVMGREQRWTRGLVDSLAQDGFDSWLGAAALTDAGSGARPGMRRAAWSLLPDRLAPADVADQDAHLLEVLDFLVQDAIDDASALRAEDLVRRLEPLAAEAWPENPSIFVWKESLAARIALAHGDTASAIAGLQRVTRRINEPYGAFLPLASLPTQRRLLATLLRATNAQSSAIDQVASSFRRSWSIADALFVPFASANVAK